MHWYIFEAKLKLIKIPEGYLTRWNKEVVESDAVQNAQTLIKSRYLVYQLYLVTNLTRSLKAV